MNCTTEKLCLELPTVDCNSQDQLTMLPDRLFSCIAVLWHLHVKILSLCYCLWIYNFKDCCRWVLGIHIHVHPWYLLALLKVHYRECGNSQQMVGMDAIWSVMEAIEFLTEQFLVYFRILQLHRVGFGLGIPKPILNTTLKQYHIVV